MTKKINYLDSRGQVRNKIGIWLGSNTHQAVLHTIKELTANSGDLLMEGIGSQIIWTLHDEKTVEIFDDGSGLPIEGETIITKKDSKGNEIHETKSNVELLLLTLFAGTKHNGLDTGEENTGTNGVFNTILTYSSKSVEYEIGRPNGNIYYCSFEEGFIKEDLHIIGKTDKTYTKIKYTLSDEVFVDNYFKFNEICDICGKQSALINKSITVIDQVNNLEKTFKLENGIEELLDKLINIEEKIYENIIIKNNSEQSIRYDNKDYTDRINFHMVMNYTKEESNNIQIEFLNRSELIDHGAIQEGIQDGLKRSFNEFIKKKGLYIKNEKNITKEDILYGLNYIVDFKSLHPNMFIGQTKYSSNIEYFKQFMINSIVQYFEIFSIENQENMNLIINQILLNKRVREKAEVNRKNIKKELEEKITNQSNRPEKYVPCRSKIPSEIKLTLIEGDSSLGSVKLARNSYDTSILPLKGKPINPFKSKLDKLLNNDEIKAIFKILGCGMEYKGHAIKGIPKFNIDNLQVDRIQIATDFDFDGFHIQVLLLGTFYTLAPELLKQGKIYILYTPLYVIRIKNKIEYKNEITDTLLAYSEQERNDIIAKLNKENISFKETRFKGLGGLSVPIMSKALSEKDIILKQITMNDVEESKKWLELFLSEEKLKERKDYIETYGDKYFDYSLFE